MGNPILGMFRNYMVGLCISCRPCVRLLDIHFLIFFLFRKIIIQNILKTIHLSDSLHTHFLSHDDLTLIRSLLCSLRPLSICSVDTRPYATLEALKSSASEKMMAKSLTFWVKSPPPWAYALSPSNSSNPPTSSTLSYSSTHSAGFHLPPNSNSCLSCFHASSTLPDYPHLTC